MNRHKQVGLIASGPMIDTTLARQRGLCRTIGPVAASSLRLASRYANALKAGHAARVEEFAECALVVIQSPAGRLEEVLRLLGAAKLDWRRRSVALLSDELDSEAIGALRESGASVCAAMLAPPAEKPLMVADGDARAVAEVRAWAGSGQVRSFELRRGTRQVFGAGLTAATVLAGPVMDSAERSLRACGMGAAETRRIIGHLMEMALRSHGAGGRKVWPNPAAPSRRNVVLAQLAASTELDRRLAAFQRKALAAALEFYDQPAAWLGEEGEAETSVGLAASSIQ